MSSSMGQPWHWPVRESPQFPVSTSNREKPIEIGLGPLFHCREHDPISVVNPISVPVSVTVSFFPHHKCRVSRKCGKIKHPRCWSPARRDRSSLEHPPLGASTLPPPVEETSGTAPATAGVFCAAANSQFPLLDTFACAGGFGLVEIGLREHGHGWRQHQSGCSVLNKCKATEEGTGTTAICSATQSENCSCGVTCALG